MTTDLIERLRKESIVFDIRGRDIANEAADTIEAQAAEIERWKKHYQELMDRASIIPTLHNRVERQAALLKMAKEALIYPDNGKSYQMSIELIEEALAAIEEAEKEQPFGYWHQGTSNDASDFFLYGECGSVGDKCDKCIALYTRPQPAPSVQDGWKLVPIEPTEEMLNAMASHGNAAYLPTRYAAMLAAAPAAPSAPTPEQERKAAEHEYCITAFNYPEAPVGSRDWTLYWAGWRARAANAQLGAGETVTDYPECSGNPADCPENEGYGCCKGNHETAK